MPSAVHEGDPPKKKNGLFRRLFTASHSSLRKSSAPSALQSQKISAPRPVVPPKDTIKEQETAKQIATVNGVEPAKKEAIAPPLLDAEKRNANSGRAYSFASTETSASYTSAAEAPVKIVHPPNPPAPENDTSEKQTLHDGTSNDASSTTSTTVAKESPTNVIPGAFPSQEAGNVPSTPEIVVEQETLDCYQASTIAEQLFQGQAPFVTHDQTASWLGDSGSDRAKVRDAYMELFDFTDKNVLTSLRRLCDRLYLKAESQQIDRLLDAFADRWCQCNPRHGFKSPGVVYTLAYSILLLNTDHHSEEFQGQKRMPRSQYVHQTLDTMRNLLKAEEEEKSAQDSASTTSSGGTANTKRWSVMGGGKTPDHYNALVSDPTKYTNREWESVIVNVLKQVYNSVDMIPLNLAREKSVSNNNRLYPQASLTSMANSSRTSLNGDNNSLLNRFSNVNRRSWLNHDTWSDYEYQGAIANNTRQVTKRRSMYAYSTSSNNSGGTLAVENIGFAGALRNTMIREEQQGFQHRSKSSVDLGSSSPDSVADASQLTEATTATSVNDSNSLFTSSTSPEAPVPAEGTEDYIALQGAPWAKEGLLKFQAYLDTGNVTKKQKKRDWVQVFVVVHKGYLKMFRFDEEATPLSHRRSRTRLNSQYINNQTYTRPSHENLRSSSFENVTVGAGNWMENATMTDNISLCHTMAQVNPVQKEGDHSAKRSSMIISSYNYQGGVSASPEVEDSTQWSLTLPSQGVLIFLAGTRDIAEEYVYACNYWASRISKEPLLEAVSSVEYGWSRPLEILSEGEKRNAMPSVSHAAPFDALLVNRERIQIKEWKPPVSSTVHCSLGEAEQLESMKKYVETVRHNFETHSDHRVKMMKLFKPSYLVTTRAHANWERKSQYLLKESVKYDMYISTLQRAIDDRQSYETRRLEDSPETSNSEQSDNETLPTDEENEKCDNDLTTGSAND